MLLQADAVASGGGPGATVEHLERDAGGLTDEQRMAAVMADAPELAALLSELQGSLSKVRSHVGPVLNEVKQIKRKFYLPADTSATSLGYCVTAFVAGCKTGSRPQC